MFLILFFAILTQITEIYSQNTVCLASFTVKQKTPSANGFQVPDIVTLQNCLAYCEYFNLQNKLSNQYNGITPSPVSGVPSIASQNMTSTSNPSTTGSIACLAVDYDNSVTTPCWLHTDPNYVNSYYDSPTANQYILNGGCQQSVSIKDMDYPITWSIFKDFDTNILLSASPQNISTLFDCFIYCRFIPSCLAVSYNSIPVNAPGPICIAFSTSLAFDSKHLISSFGNIIFAFTKTSDSSPNLTNKTIGRCSGQYFPPSSQWCPPGSNITVLSKQYKIHPLCCKSNFNPLIAPPNSPQLSSFSINLLDPPYDQTITDCLNNNFQSAGGDVNNCVLTAKSLSGQGILNIFCSHSERYSSNYVAITYQCTNTATFTTISSFTIPPSHPSFSISSISSTDGNGGNTINPNYNMNDNNKNVDQSQVRAALVLGAIGTTFAIICILSLLFCLAYYCYVARKRSGNWEFLKSGNATIPIIGKNDTNDPGESQIGSIRVFNPFFDDNSIYNGNNNKFKINSNGVSEMGSIRS